MVIIFHMDIQTHLPLSRFFLAVFTLLIIAASPAQSALSVSFSWNPNTEPDIAGYRLHYGTASKSYTQLIDVKTTTATVSNLTEGTKYYFAVSAYNTAGAESAFSAELSYPTSPALPGLANVSSRTFVQTDDNVMIGGFIITGDAPKKVILRAIGPSLAAAGVNQAMSDPTLDLLDSSGAVIASNDSWTSSDADLAALGLAPTDGRESAIVTTLSPGAYSAIVRGKNATTGIALVELYDLDPANGQIANISTRGRVDTGDNVMIGGFILGGAGPTKVIVRAIGPSLVASGVSDALLNPTLELHDGNGSLIFTNDNWRSDQESLVIDSTIPPTDDREAAIVATLDPGAYSAVLRGAGGTTGVALFEVYALSQ